MSKRVAQILLLTVFIFITACESDDDNSAEIILTNPCESVIPTPEHLKYIETYDKPIIENTNNATFYSNEIVEIRWTLPNGLSNTELQIIETDAPFTCDDYGKFHDLNNDFSAGYGNQYVHYYSVSQFLLPLENPKYISYRARTKDIELNTGYSHWTDVKSFTILPLSGLNKTTITVPYTFNFITEDNNNEYYSGVTSASDYKLIDIAADNILDFNKIQLVRIIDFESHFLTHLDNGANPFSKLILGFDEAVNPAEDAYPFKVVAEVFPGTFQDNPISGNLYGTYSQNLVSVMNNYDLKLAYLLDDIVGAEHQIQINFTFEVYSID